MDIKKLKPSGRYQSGKYIPQNPSKYIGDINNIIYRSSWERKFSQYCDLNPNILKWSSEPLIIKYWSPIDKKEHNYHPDYYIKVVNSKGEIEEWILDIKPQSQYKLDKKPAIKGNITEKKLKSYNEKLKIWITNRAKFEAATRFAESRGYKFGAIDESFILR
jgi:hypothetical protein